MFLDVSSSDDDDLNMPSAPPQRPQPQPADQKGKNLGARREGVLERLGITTIQGTLHGDNQDVSAMLESSSDEDEDLLREVSPPSSQKSQVLATQVKRKQGFSETTQPRKLEEKSSSMESIDAHFKESASSSPRYNRMRKSPVLKEDIDFKRKFKAEAAEREKKRKLQKKLRGRKRAEAQRNAYGQGETIMSERPHFKNPEFLGNERDFVLGTKEYPIPEPLLVDEELAEAFTEAAKDEFQKDIDDEKYQRIKQHRQRADHEWSRIRERRKFSNESSDSVSEALASSSEEVVKIPWRSNRYLAKYQREGVEFLFDVFSGATCPGNSQRGAILADEMGLGKTCQAITLLSAIFHKTGSAKDKQDIDKRQFDPESRRAFMDRGGPVLVVVPASLVENWTKELSTWGFFSVEVLQNLKREEILAGVKRATQAMSDVVLLGYEAMKQLLSTNDDFARMNWNLIFFDECHRLKNYASRTSRSARQLKSRCKIGLTGTPISNSMEEIWSICNVLCPEVFATRKNFQREFVIPLRRGRLQNAKPQELRKMREVQAELNLTLKRLLLRRQKDLIAHKLYGKKDTMVLCPLTPVQEHVYLRALNSPDFVKLIEAVSKRSIQWKRDLPVEDKYLSIPSNRATEYATDRTPNPHAPFWRLQHRVHADGSVGLKSKKKLSSVKVKGKGKVEGEDEDEGDSKDMVGLESVGDMQIKQPYVLKKHESSEDESDEEGENCLRVFSECGACSLCMQMPAIILLAKIANHLDLIRVDKEIKDKREKRARFRIAKKLLGPDGEVARTAELLQDDDPDAKFFRSMRWENLIDDTSCGKMIVLRKLLRRWYDTGGIKVLIFSTSLVILNILEQYVKSLSYGLLRLDGTTPTKLRQGLCDKFNKDPQQFVFLMSTRAGGEGLNLTGASKVVIFDPDWNPSSDLQAQDRAYRLGQIKTVRVYRLISQGTVEESKYLRQVDKTQMSTTVLEGSTEKRLFEDNEFRGVIELLRFSRVSFTAHIDDRYASRRKKYVARDKQGRLNKLVRHTDCEDVAANDSFTMFRLDDEENDEQENEKEGKKNKNDSDDDKDITGQQEFDWGQLVGDSKEEAAFVDDAMLDK